MYRYYAKRMQMTADLKRVAHEVRARRPDLFRQLEINESSMDGEGKVTTGIRKDSKATALSPRARHALATRRD